MSKPLRNIPTQHLLQSLFQGAGKAAEKFYRKQAEEEQYGFRPNRSTQDLIFMMKQISEKVIEKSRGFACFVDLNIAFDRVQKADISRALKEYDGVHIGLRKAILSLKHKKMLSGCATIHQRNSQQIKESNREAVLAPSCLH